MSFLTKLFVILSTLLSFAFIAIAGMLLAKQEEFKTRYAAEKVEREREVWLQERMRNYLASLQERKRIELHKRREQLLIASEARARATQAKNNAVKVHEEVTKALDGFDNFTNRFDGIVREYRSTLDGLIQKTQNLARRRDSLSDLKSELWLHLAQSQAEVGRLREHLNVLDYKLYVLRQTNEEKRQLIRLYMEADPTLMIPGFGSELLPYGEIVAVDQQMGVVVINQGHNSRVELNMVFTVTRGNEFVGNIEITDVYDNRSTGRIIQRTLNRPLQPGDKVRPRASFSSAISRDN